MTVRRGSALTTALQSGRAPDGDGVILDVFDAIGEGGRMVLNLILILVFIAIFAAVGKFR